MSIQPSQQPIHIGAIKGLAKILRWSFDRLFLTFGNVTMKLKYMRSYPKYFISLLVIDLLCLCIFWLLAYIDNFNMINNGYISSHSIYFTTKKASPFQVDKDKYMLFQFNSNSPNFKHVLISGDVQLPPIKYVEKRTFSQKSSIAVIGKQVNKENIPPTVKVVGYFDTPNSYKLNSEVWVLSKNRKINFKNGSSFIFSTPKKNVESVFYKNIKTDSINVINREDYGTYALKSNQTIIIGLYIALIFLIAFFVFISTNWMSQDKNIIRILYLSGTPIYSLYFFIWKWKVLPYSIFSLLLMLLAIIIQKSISRLWSGIWLIDTAYILILFLIYLCVCCLLTVTFYTVGKGGKRF